MSFSHLINFSFMKGSNRAVWEDCLQSASRANVRDALVQCYANDNLTNEAVTAFYENLELQTMSGWSVGCHAQIMAQLFCDPKGWREFLELCATGSIPIYYDFDEEEQKGAQELLSTLT
jgi:hypothetical protein